MKCSTCASTIGPGNSFCENCGSPVPDEAMVPYQRQHAVADGADANGAAPAAVDWGTLAPIASDQGSVAVTEDTGQGMRPYEPTLPDSPVRLGIDEFLWRRYHVLQMRGLAKGAGHLYVTNSRVVFYAYSNGFFLQKPSKLVRETKIAEISGINAYVTRRFSFALL